MSIQKFGFPDTNTFLHYEPINHIDWPTLLGADEAVLVISPVVIRELNRQKDAPTSAKIRERAAKILKKLYNWSEQSPPIMIRAGVELQFRAQDPLIDFAAEKLSRDIMDDQLVASMIEFRTENSASNAIVITEDLGLKLKCRSHGIPVLQLPGDLRLKDEPDASQKRISQLEEEVRRLQHRIPDLKLLFSNSDDKLRLHIAPLDPELERTRTMEEIRAAYPRLESDAPSEKPKSPMTIGDLFGITFGGIPAEQVEKYNREVEAFFAEHEKHLNESREYRDLQARTAELRITLVNEGTCPAEDVDIFMHFPDGFELLNEDDLPEKPIAPKPPTKPRTIAEQMQGFRAMPDISFPNALLDAGRYIDVRRRPLPAPRNVSRPSIRRTKSYDVNVRVAKLKHGFVTEFDPMFLVFRSIDSAGSFTIDYRIHAANAPDPMEGELHVIVEKPNSVSSES